MKHPVGIHTLARIRQSIPISEWLPAYDRSWLKADVVAGLSVWALFVPEGMAYAGLAGMPPETGLYTGLMALIAYAIFGSSRQLVVGPSSAVAVMSAATIAPIAQGDSDVFFAATAWLALLVGLAFTLAWVLRLGFLSNFMSEAVLSGFSVGLGLVIAAGQLGKLFGVEYESDNFFEDVWGVAEEAGEIVWNGAVVGLVALLMLFALHRFAPRWPAALIVVVLAVAASTAVGMEDNGVHVVGDIPAALPAVGLPDLFSFGLMIDLLPGALGIFVVALAESIAAARTFATKHEYAIDPDQELLALGTSNIAVGLTQGFVVDGSMSRTTANDGAGARTQVANLVQAVLVLITILAFAWFFEALPEPVLAAIVIHAVWKLITFRDFSYLHRTKSMDFWSALTCFGGVLFLGILEGIVLAIVVNIVLLLARASDPHWAILGTPPNIDAFVNVEHYPDAETIDGLLILRWDALLFFANAQVFHDTVIDQVRQAPTPITEVLIDAEAINEVDTTALGVIVELREHLEARGIALRFARVRKEILSVIMRGDVMDRPEAREQVVPTVRDGVAEFLARQAVDDLDG